MKKELVAIILIFISFNIYADEIKTLTLTDGIKAVLQNNTTLKISSYNHSIAVSSAQVAKAALLPQLSASASQTFLATQPIASFGLLTIPESEKDFLSYNITASQLLYDFGGAYSLYNSEKINIEISDQQNDITKNLTVLNFITAYCDCLESDKMVLVADKETESIQSHLKDAQSLFKEGVITKNDLLQAEVKLSDSQQRLLTAKNTRAVMYNTLNNLLGKPLSTQWNIQDIPYSIEPSFDMEISVETAEKQRKEIRIMDNSLKSLNLYEKYLRAKYMPRLFFQGGFSYLDEPPDLLPKYQWAAILGINIDIFNGGKTKSEIYGVEEKEKQLFEERDKTVEDIKLEVEKNYLDVTNNIDKIDVTRSAISQAEENLRINNLRYTEGVGTATDVIDAITLFTDSETNYYQAFYEYQKARASLLYSTGYEMPEMYNK